MMNMENIQELKFYGKCFNEVLRLEPPVQASTAMMVIEDTDICNVRFRKGDPFQIDMYGLGRNPKEWQRPNEFLPERFDP